MQQRHHCQTGNKSGVSLSVYIRAWTVNSRNDPCNPKTILHFLNNKLLLSVTPLKQSHHDNVIMKINDHENSTLSLRDRKLQRTSSFCNPASLAPALHAPRNIFQLYFLFFFFSSQQPHAPPTTSPSSVRRASTSPLLRAQLLFGQVLFFCLSFPVPVVVLHIIACNFIINRRALATPSLWCSFH